MDPKFNEACAEAWTGVQHRYCLMQKGTKFQWRWIPPYPPECKGDPAVSPCFDSQLEAMEWASKRHTGHFVTVHHNEWRPIEG